MLPLYKGLTTSYSFHSTWWRLDRLLPLIFFMHYPWLELDVSKKALKRSTGLLYNFAFMYHHLTKKYSPLLMRRICLFSTTVRKELSDLWVHEPYYFGDRRMQACPIAGKLAIGMTRSVISGAVWQAQYPEFPTSLHNPRPSLAIRETMWELTPSQACQPRYDVPLCTTYGNECPGYWPLLGECVFRKAFPKQPFW